jgi:hypothetical protein
VAPRAALTEALPNGGFTLGFGSGAPKNALSGALLPWWSQKNVVPSGCDGSPPHFASPTPKRAQGQQLPLEGRGKPAGGSSPRLREVERRWQPEAGAGREPEAQRDEGAEGKAGRWRRRRRPPATARRWATRYGEGGGGGVGGSRHGHDRSYASNAPFVL